MIGARIVLKRGTHDEAEKPFWISYADLMTALSVLFLVCMSAALLAVTKTVDKERLKQIKYDDAIERLKDLLEQAARDSQVGFDRKHQTHSTYSFQDKVLFDIDRHQLSAEQSRFIRSFAPRILEVANTDVGNELIKQVVVEGFTDGTGSYLHNLNLSLLRSQRIICALLDPALDRDFPLTDAQRTQIRELFVVGGYSYNQQKATKEESRRVEFKVDFYGMDEKRRDPQPQSEIGACKI